MRMTTAVRCGITNRQILQSTVPTKPPRLCALLDESCCLFEMVKDLYVAEKSKDTLMSRGNGCSIYNPFQAKNNLCTV